MTKYALTDTVIATRAELGSGAVPLTGTVRPPFGLFIAYDTGEFFIETGSGWTKVGQIGIPVDASGNISPTGKIIAATTSVPGAPTAGANAGTTPPAPVLAAGSNDVAGSITFGTGTTPALGEQVVVVFGTAYAATPKAIIVVATNAATGLKIPCTVAKATTGFSIGLAVAPAGSQANTVYAVDYLVVA